MILIALFLWSTQIILIMRYQMKKVTLRCSEEALFITSFIMALLTLLALNHLPFIDLFPDANMLASILFELLMFFILALLPVPTTLIAIRILRKPNSYS